MTSGLWAMESSMMMQGSPNTASTSSAVTISRGAPSATTAVSDPRGLYRGNHRRLVRARPLLQQRLVRIAATGHQVRHSDPVRRDRALRQAQALGHLPGFEAADAQRRSQVLPQGDGIERAGDGKGHDQPDDD